VVQSAFERICSVLVRHYLVVCVQVETEMINQMDALVEGGRGDEQYMQLFRDTYVSKYNHYGIFLE